MITSIHGTLVATSPLLAVIETGGLGYDVHIPVTTAEKLPATGAQVKLHTLAVYREDAQTLYGFATVEERDFFRLLIDNVTGVGPKGALTIMSKLSLSLLESAIRAGDIATLANCPGIGKKTAERLVVELKSKLDAPAAGESISSGSSSSPAGAAPVDSKQHDAVMALMALGYKAADADQAVRRAALALGGRVTTEALVKKALNG
ncbi:MAG TPA: Holliday junction branch migration protein RuvA [Opitutaceae bacterium]|jgi:Holliday junction DNA helicase RuvA|nr:Holliday junction branch migration protein RuvA [Opitutaceae bacterium]